MARPRRPVAERDAVVQAAAILAPAASARIQAKAVAKAVVAELLADAERVDPFDRAMFEARQAITQDPVIAIVVSAEIDLASILHKKRMARFEARGCVQIGQNEWAAETSDIASEIRLRLESRYRHFFTKLAKNYVSGHSTGAGMSR